MKISLMISVYNRLDLLHKSLLSIARQKRLPDEVILTDDGSDADIVSFYLEHVSLIPVPFHLVRQEHAGFRLARLRNNGVHVSTGDLLMFLDQDIIISEEYIQKFEQSVTPNRFFVSYPIRLSKEQSEQITDEVIHQNTIPLLLTGKQRNKPVKQYRKDRLNLLLYKMHLAQYGAKLRGGVCAIRRQDYLNVNGYDENFIGWGNEDDDMSRRLLATGVIGLNVTKQEYSYHLYHEPNNSGGIRVNKEYAGKAMLKIKSGDFRCEKGLDSERNDLQIWKNGQPIQ
ncbi:MAG TPA: galactosyltransferase-related protein [Candidatus Cloacimonadota bacterium]|nr:galactosyltransferase-related protein [Candidatus Cloacimonadota bacterium]